MEDIEPEFDVEKDLPEEECIHNSETDINDLQAQSIVLDRTISLFYLFYQLKLNYGIEYCYNRLAIHIRPEVIRTDFCNCLFRDSCNKSRHFTRS